MDYQAMTHGKRTILTMIAVNSAVFIRANVARAGNQIAAPESAVKAGAILTMNMIE